MKHLFRRRNAARLIAWSVVISSVLLGASRYAPPVYESEEEAVSVGKNLDIGFTMLEGPSTVEVLSHQTWTFVYTAGKAGIRPGGAIRVALRHIHEWSPPQTQDPQKDGFISVQTTGDAQVEVRVADRKRASTPQYFPWPVLVRRQWATAHN